MANAIQSLYIYTSTKILIWQFPTHEKILWMTAGIPWWSTLIFLPRYSRSTRKFSQQPVWRTNFFHCLCACIYITPEPWQMLWVMYFPYTTIFFPKEFKVIKCHWNWIIIIIFNSFAVNIFSPKMEEGTPKLMIQSYHVSFQNRYTWVRGKTIHQESPRHLFGWDKV